MAESKVGQTAAVGLMVLLAVGTVCRRNQMPDAPAAPRGPVDGEINETYRYRTVTSDPDADSVRFHFDWGDSVFEWTGYCASGETAELTHEWLHPAAYGVKVQAQDKSGGVSAWSSGLPVAISGYPNYIAATIMLEFCHAWDVVVMPTSDIAYVSKEYCGEVDVISRQRGTPLTTIADSRFGGDTRGLAVLPSGEYVYVACPGAGCVSVIRTSDNAVVATVATEDAPVDVVASPDGRFVYTASRDVDNSISVIRTADNTVVQTVPLVASPKALAIAPDGGKVYVLCWDCSVLVLNAATCEVEAVIPLGGDWAVDIAAMRRGDLVFVAGGDGDCVSVIRSGSDSVAARVPLRSWPGGISVLPGDKYVYVITGSDSVSIIRTRDLAVVAEVELGFDHTDLAATPDGKWAYVIPGSVGGQDHRVKVLGCW